MILSTLLIRSLGKNLMIMYLLMLLIRMVVLLLRDLGLPNLLIWTLEDPLLLALFLLLLDFFCGKNYAPARYENEERKTMRKITLMKRVKRKIMNFSLIKWLGKGKMNKTCAMR